VRTTRRSLLALGGGAAVSLAAVMGPGAAPADAQAWPERPVTMIVPFPPGGGTDTFARPLAAALGEQLGQTFVVENRPGAGGTIGAGMVAKSAPDGYTVLAYGALATAHALHTKLPYDTLNDFVAVIPFGQQPLVVVTAPGKGYKTLRDLIAAAKAKPGALNYSSAGIGSASHFAAERLRVSAGIEAQHIAFKGAAEAVTEVVAERIDFSPQLFTTTLPLLRDGKLMALAVSANKRTSVMPEVPTTIEAGLAADSVYPFYSGLFLPAKTPRDIVEKLQREAAKALQAPAVQARFTTLGVEPMAMTLDEFAKFVRDDVEAAVTLVKAAKIPTQ
jgi:tripartite-type tricarboxylate transporter receptor subunit TctC